MKRAGNLFRTVKSSVITREYTCRIQLTLKKKRKLGNPFHTFLLKMAEL